MKQAPPGFAQLRVFPLSVSSSLQPVAKRAMATPSCTTRFAQSIRPHLHCKRPVCDPPYIALETCSISTHLQQSFAPPWRLGPQSISDHRPGCHRHIGSSPRRRCGALNSRENSSRTTSPHPTSRKTDHTIPPRTSSTSTPITESSLHENIRSAPVPTVVRMRSLSRA